MRVAQNDSSFAQEQGQPGQNAPDDDNTVSWSKLIFADGTTVWTRGGPAADHIFHPVMLKYVLICILIYALLQNRTGLDTMAVWQISIYWLLVTVVAVFWLFIAASVANRLLRRGTIRFVFTPLISLPLIVVVEVFFQIYLVWGLGQAFTGIASIAPYVSRDFMVILLFDIQYGTYVAPHNPAYRMSDPRLDTSIAQKLHVPDVLEQRLRAARLSGTGEAILVPPRPADVTPPDPQVATEAEAVPSRPTVSAMPEQAEPAGLPLLTAQAAPNPAPPEPMIELAGEKIRIADLLVIKAEDHYVRIHQRSRSHLLRGRFSDVIASVPPGTGIALNRSVWVAVAGVRMLHRTQDHRIMVMAMDDELHPVARARKTEVLEFARRNALPIARRKMLPSDFE
jgi:hypothetical protein